MDRATGADRALRRPAPDAMQKVGVATVLASELPAYRRPWARGRPLAVLRSGEHYPHFYATGDESWLQVTLKPGVEVSRFVSVHKMINFDQA